MQSLFPKADLKWKCPYFYSKFFLKSFGQYEIDDRSSVTETDRGCAYELNRQTNCQKNENATEIDQIDQIYKIFSTHTTMGYYIWSISVAFQCFFSLFCLSVSEARHLSVSLALGMSIRFTGTSSICWLYGFYTRNINCNKVTEQIPIFTTSKYYIWSRENVCCFVLLPNPTGQHQWCQKPNN